MSILFLACLLAICLPILSVQLPRHLPYLQARRSNPCLENRSALHQRPPPLRRRLRSPRPAPAPRGNAHDGPRDAAPTTDGADSGAPSTGEETGDEELHRQPQPVPTSGVLSVEGKMQGKGKARADGREHGRKPWDSPFGRRREGAVGNTGAWVVMPPTPPRKTGRELEAKGVAKRLFPPDCDAEVAHDGGAIDGLREASCEAIAQPTRTPTPTLASGTQDCAHIDSAEPTSVKKKAKRKPGVMSALWLCVGILAIVVSMLAFAILVAHCLAWFLVYKTEARLGEARRGIMQGGEMRLCLCAT